jgi:hypothetical protein
MGSYGSALGACYAPHRLHPNVVRPARHGTPGVAVNCEPRDTRLAPMSILTVA